MKFHLLMMTGLFCVLSVRAQENLGIANSNYAPTNSMLLNPASVVNSKTYLDINLVGASAYARNNLAYLPKSQFYFPRDIWSLNIPEPSYNTSNNRIKGYLDAGIQGPSATLQWGKHAFGFYTGARSVTSVKRIPGYLARVVIDGADPSETDYREYNDRNVRAKSMTWGEVGLSYSTILSQKNKDMWTGGITLKRLYGLQSTSFILERADITTNENNQVQINELRGKYANADFNFRAGRGWSTDIGVTYQKMLEDVTRYVPHLTRYGCDHINYKYKIGASLLDAGYIRFKNGATAREFERTTQVQNVEDIDDPDELTQVSPESGTFTEKFRFTNQTPMAISGQFDYNFENDFYINATVVQTLVHPRNYGPERANLLSITPRYERRFFEAAMPLSLHQYTSPQVGLAFRFAYLVIGTDNVVPFLFKTDVYSADVYFSLKYSLFNNPGCKSRSGRQSKKKCPGPAGS
ncbi:MAG: DUF5723 family protein [Salibacteraceae bacterium]